MATSALPSHLQNLKSNADEVNRLIQIHRRLTGSRPGRRRDVEVLNKSSIVLAVACWESFVEDLAQTAFDELARAAEDPQVFPTSVLTLASKGLRADADESQVWALAGDGWKTVLNAHRASILERFTGRLNTPKPKQVDEMFDKLIGLPRLSTSWRWSGTTSANATARLERLVELRGEIAHRVTASRAVRRQHVIDSVNFVGRLAVSSSNRVRQFVIDRTGISPWSRFVYREPWQ